MAERAGNGGRPRPWLDGPVLTGAFLLGSVAVFLGERVLPGLDAGDVARPVASGVGIALLALSAAARGWVAVRGGPGHRDAARPQALAHLGALVAVGLYFLSTDPGLALLGHDDPMVEAARRLRVALRVLFPLVWTASAVPLLLVHRASRPLSVGGGLETRRVTEAAFSGLGVAFAAALLMVVNWIAYEHDVVQDLSYFRTARPGPATRGLVDRLAEPLEVLLFFPPANEVGEEVEGYFRELAAASDSLEVRREDRLLAPALAQEHKIRSDGVVLVRKGERSEQWTVGTDLDSSRYKLKKLDQEFHQRLVKVARTGRVAYLTTGHGELTESRSRSEGRRASLLRPLLKRLGYQVKDLGLREGLGGEVPTDAAVVLVIGPEKPFFTAEADALVRYLRRGGRLFLALDPGLIDPASGLGPVLSELGLALDPAVLVNDKHHLRLRYNASDRQILYTGSYSSHASMTSLSRGARRVELVVLGAGSLERADDVAGAKIDFTVRSMTGTWADRDGDFEHDVETEVKKVYQLAAAVEREVAADEAGAAGADAGPTRAVVLADADALTDGFINPRFSNVVYFGDGVEWLAGEDGASTAIESEEDVPIEHTAQDDVLWFYGAVFGMPLLVLGVGLVGVRLRRRRS